MLLEARMHGVDEFPRGNKIPVPVGSKEDQGFIPVNAAATF